MNQKRAQIDELVLRSPVAEARCTGVMDDWRALRYTMNVTSTVDLTQLSETLQPGTALCVAQAISWHGHGRGRSVQSKRADEVRRARGGQNPFAGIERQRERLGARQELRDQRKSGRNLLNAGDFQIDSLQLAGNVMGTGTNLPLDGRVTRGCGKSYGTTLTGLILRDARAEMNDGVLNAHSSQFKAMVFQPEARK